MAAGGAHTKDCIEGIRKVLSIPDFALKCTSDVELCEILSDGEILCSLLSELSNGRVSSEGALTASCYSANSIVLARKNLKYFLNQCSQVFGLQEHEMFEPDDLLTMSNPERVVRTILRLVSGNSSSKKAEPPLPKHLNSGLTMNVVKEICDHELALTDKLIKLLMYRNELMGLLCEWSEELVQVVFMHVEQLYNVHNEFHVRLTGLAEQGCEQFCKQLASLFSDMIPKLDIYISYFTHLPTANVRMESELANSPELCNQLGMLERYFGGPSFRCLYDSPIRQLTNYLTLYTRLNDSIKNEIPEASESLEKVISDLKTLLDKANDFKRQAEQLSATKVVLEQVVNLPSDLTSPTEIGLHQADDCFKVRIGKDRKIDTHLGACILTTKQLIIAIKESKKDSQASFLLNIPIDSTLQVKKCDKGGYLEIVTEKKESVILEKPKQMRHVIDKWSNLLQETKVTNFPLGWNMKGHNFVLKSFPAGTKCSKCIKVLTGVVMQGYSCAHCDKQYHQHCLKQLNCMRRDSAPSLPVRRSANEFYHKNINRDKSEDILMKRELGTFIIRDSRQGGRALSIRAQGKVVHINIVESQGQFALGNEICWFDGLDLLLDYYRHNNMSIHFSAFDFCLRDGVLSKGIRQQRTLREE